MREEEGADNEENCAKIIFDGYWIYRKPQPKFCAHSKRLQECDVFLILNKFCFS